MLLAFMGLFITSHTHGDGNVAASNTPPPASYFDSSHYTPKQLSFSTINDGIPDVWKEYYGFSLANPELAQADYNGTGTTNLVKYLANLWPLDTTPPEPPQPPPAIKPVTTTKSLAASTPASGAPLLPIPPILANGNFSGTVTLGHSSTNGYGGARFEWGYNTSINGWKALHGSQIEVWSVNGNQFVELDASNGSYGIKQQVTNSKAGTYLLTWKHRGRDSAQAGNNAYRAFVYTEGAGGSISRRELAQKHFPAPPQVVSKTVWNTQVLAFTVTEADLIAAGALKKSLWIALEPDGNNTYGALIDDVSLTPVELEIQRGGIDKQNWMTQNGIIRDVVSVWDIDPAPLVTKKDGGSVQRLTHAKKYDWLKLRLSGLTNIASELPQGTIKWHVPDFNGPIANNSVETPEISWPAGAGIHATGTTEKIELEIGGKKFNVWVDIPDVGDMTQEDWAIQMTMTNVTGALGVASAYLSKPIADNWSESHTELLESKRNALRHSYWMALCSQSVFVGPNWAALLGCSHENHNKYIDGASPSESTMDLHNNLVGTTVTSFWDPLGHLTQTELLHLLADGTLWIWESDGVESSGMRATKKADGKAIYPQP